MSIKATVYPHPFKPQYKTFPDIDGFKTIQQVVDLYAPAGRAFVVHNGFKVDDFSVALKDGDTIIVKVIPAGNRESTQNMGAKGLANIGIGIGLFIAGFFTAGATWGFAAAFFTVGLGLGIASAVIAQGSMGRAAEEEMAKSASIRGGKNQFAPWGKVPSIFGKHLITPYYAAKPYTSISGTYGEDMYLHQLFVVGYKTTKLSSIKFGESMFATNAAETLSGALTVNGIFTGTAQVYNDGTNPTIYPTIVNEDQPNLELLAMATTTGIQWFTTPPLTTSATVTITLPYGLFEYTEAGALVAKALAIQVKRRVAGSGTAFDDATLVNTFSLSSTRKAIMRYDYTDSGLAAGQYEYALRRTTAADATDFRGSTKCFLTAVKSYRTGDAVNATTRAKFCVLAIKAKATDNLQGVVDQVNCIAEAAIPVYDGSGSGADDWTGTGYSQNPAAIFLNILRGAANPRPVADASIDWPQMEHWYTVCASNGWTCNAVANSSIRIRDILNQVASCGRAQLTLRDWLYSVVIDEAKLTIVQHFTPRNTRNFVWSKAFIDKPHALKINYINAADGYAPNERIVYADDYTELNATKFQQVNLFGITTSDLAWKQARYNMAVAQLRPESFSFECDAENLVAEVGDLVRLSHDAMLVGLRSGRVKSVTVDGSDEVDTITVDELITIGAASYAVRVRKSDGTSQYSTLTNAAGDTYTLTLTTPMAAKPEAGDLFIFGEAGIETIECLVSGIEMQDDLSARVQLVPEAPGVHTADTGDIPAYESFVSRPPELASSGAQPNVINQAVNNQAVQASNLPTVVAANDTETTATIINTVAPRYLGRYDSAHPATYNLGDWWTVFDTNDDPITRGVWWNDAGTPARITTASSMALQAKLVEALPDIAWAEENSKGTASDYGVNTLFASLGVVTAFINSLFAKHIKVLTGGSVRGGDRFATDGTVDSATDAGFYLGADGSLKSASVSGSGFSVDPATGGAFTGIDLRLGESELITTNFDGDTLSHELGAMQWRDADGNDIGRIGLMNDAPNPIVERVLAAVNTGTSVAAGDTMAGSYNNYCSVQQGKKIYVFPSGANPVQIYDSVANTFTDGDTLGNYTRYIAILYNGKVYLPQYGGTNLEIYDIATDTVSAGATLGNYNRITAQLYNGKIYLPRSGGTNLEIYDIATDTVSAGATLGNYSRYTSQLYGGKIYLPQYGGTNFEIYDIASNAVSAAATLGNYSRATSQLYNGKIYLPRADGTNLEIYDIVSDTVSAGATLGNYIRLASHLYNGKIYLPTSNQTKLEIYDIAANTVSLGVTLADRERVTTQFYNGKIYLPQSSGTGLEIVTVGENCALGAGIIERVTTSTTEYIKFSDGTMMQRCRETNSAACTTAYGALYYSGSIQLDFPTSFVDTDFDPALTLTYTGVGSVLLETKNAAYVKVRVMNGTNTTFNATVTCVAWGRWRA